MAHHTHSTLVASCEQRVCSKFCCPSAHELMPLIPGRTIKPKSSHSQDPTPVTYAHILRAKFLLATQTLAPPAVPFLHHFHNSTVVFEKLFSTGNGIVEPGEQCDDSTSCCNQVTCQLTSGAQCSPGTSAECCSAACQVHTQTNTILFSPALRNLVDVV